MMPDIKVGDMLLIAQRNGGFYEHNHKFITEENIVKYAKADIIHIYRKPNPDSDKYNLIWERSGE